MGKRTFKPRTFAARVFWPRTLGGLTSTTIRTKRIRLVGTSREVCELVGTSREVKSLSGTQP